MASVSKIEPIKQLILETLKTDPTVKYEILGWVTEQFVPKVDLNKVLEEIRISREYSDKRFEAIDKRFEAIDKRFEEQVAEIKALRVDTNKRFEEQRADTNKRFDSVNIKIDALGSRWGLISESAFREGLLSIVEDLFNGKVEKWRVLDKEGYVYGHSCEVELDIVISNGKLILGEIKASVNKSEVAAFKRIVQFYEKETNNKPDRILIITPFVDTRALSLAARLGIEIFTEV